jgi:hypothetical protein
MRSTQPPFARDPVEGRGLRCDNADPEALRTGVGCIARSACGRIALFDKLEANPTSDGR